MILLTFCLALSLALIHLLIGRLHLLHHIPRNLWLSGAAGVAVSFVFLPILPALAAHQRLVAAELDLSPHLAEVTVFAIAFGGLLTFYGLEHMARSSRQGAADSTGPNAFSVHIGSFAIYNLLIGYLLVHREKAGLPALLVFFVAMATHFVTNDVGLRRHHQTRYHRLGRWLVAGAVLAGWGLGVTVALPELGIAVLFAFLAGGVILNVLKEELPRERQSRFLPFLLGALGYGVLMVAISVLEPLPR
jgi:hypothetical protein